ncbi:MAG: copper chaperone PCu(A)C [Reyranellaceae bacterium]
MFKLFRSKTEAPPVPVARLGDLAFARPWARLGTGPTAPAAGQVGGYLTVVNGTETDDRLLSATCAAADTVSIHAIKVIGAGIRMQPLADGLAIPPATTIELRPRGYHLLIEGFRQPPSVGSRLTVGLVFERAGRLELELPITEQGPVGNDVLSD